MKTRDKVLSTTNPNITLARFKIAVFCFYGLLLFSLTTGVQAQSLDYKVPASYDLSTAAFNSIALSVATEDINPLDMIFNADGTVLYVLGRTGIDINQYDLATAYDISTAVFNGTALSVATEDISPRSILFDGTGSQLFVLGRTNNDIFQYNLSTNYAISTASVVGAVLNVDAQEAFPTSMVFNNDGSKLYITGFDNDINQYNLSSAYDLSTASFDSIALDISTQVTNPRSLVFSDNGTKLYILGSTGTVREIYHYSLSTAYDITTALFNGDSFSVFTEESSPRSILINNAGTTIYLMGIVGDDINQYDVGVNWYPEAIANNGSIDNSLPLTIELSGDTFSTSSAPLSSVFYSVGNLPTGLSATLSIDGSATVATLTLTGNAIDHQINDDISNLTFAFTDDAFSNNVAANIANSGSVSAYDTEIGINFTDNPSLDYVVDQHYDISIASFNSTVLDVSAQESFPFTMLFNNDGSKLYIAGSNDDDINQYDLTTAFDVSTATFNRVAFKETGFTKNLYSMLFNDDGTMLYLLESSGIIWQYNLSTAYDIATAIAPMFVPWAFEMPNSYQAIDMIYNDNGSILYVLDLSTKDIYQYDLSRPYDISSAIEVGSIVTLDSISGITTSMVFNRDGTKLFVASVGPNEIHQYNLSTAYDLSTDSFSHITHDLGLTDAAGGITSLLFDDDGSRLYVAEVGGNPSIKQYDINKTIYTETLSNDGVVDNSSPLIINLAGDTFTTSSGALPSNQYSVGNVPTGLTPVLTIDGTSTQATLTLTGNATAHDDIHDVSDLTFAFTDTAFTSGDAANVINSGFNSDHSTDVPVDFLDDFRLDYRLTAIGDFTTAAYTGVALAPGFSQAMVFNNNGHILYTVNADRNIHQYNLLREYDISTARYAGIVLNVSGQIISTTSIMFNNDGSKLYLLSLESKKVKQYNLSSAYDISTASFAVNALSILAHDSDTRSMMFNNDGTILYVLGIDPSDNSIITQYNLAIAYDITTASFSQIVLNVSAQERVATSMLFSKDGSKLYVMGWVDDEINQYDLAIPYDISTASFDRISFSIAVEEPDSRSMILNGDGSTVYVLGRNGIHQYNISASVYQETSANDGFIDNSRPLVIELSDGTFTTNSTPLPTNQYSITGVPAGLTAVLNIDASATKATLTFSGTADNHQDLDDIIANLTFSFSDAAFTSGDASNIINSGSISPFGFNVDFDFDDNITMTYALGIYTENSANLGVVDNSNPLTLNLAGDITTGYFTTTSGPLPSDLYRIGRVPDGLTPILTIDSTGTLATLTFSGAADPHQMSNNVTELLFRFYDGAFTNNDSDIIINSGFRPNNAHVAAVAIEFDGNTRLSYVANAPYDIANNIYKERLFDVDQLPFDHPQSMLFNNDGTKLYAIGFYEDFTTDDDIGYRIIEHNVSIPFNISTASYSQISLHMPEADNLRLRSMVFNGNGTILYLLGATESRVYQYNLSSNYEVATASFAGSVLNVSASLPDPTSMVFNNDGSQLYIMDRSNAEVRQYDLTTNYDVSTASYSGFFLSVGAQESLPYSMMFNNDGSRLYIIGGDKEVNQYDLSSNYDVSTASFKQVAINLADHNLSGDQYPMLYGSSGNTFFILSLDYIYLYNLKFDVFPEALANDGSIDNTAPLVIDLLGLGETFSISSGILPSSQYTIGNLPPGLTPELTIGSSGTQAILNISGNAAIHQNINDMTNLTFTFTDDAFTSGNSANILNSGFSTVYNSNIGIDFEDNPGFPIAVDNNYLVNVNGSVDINPLNGDNDPQGDPLAIVSINGINLVSFAAQTIPVNNGTVDITIGNFISFTPDTNFYGTVRFPYIISDGNGGTATANQIIVVDVDALISGNVTGLNGSLQIQNNGGDNLQISSNGPYQFSTLLNSGDNYLVSITSQPSSPNQTCVLMNNSGMIVDADISNIDISCTTNKYFIGGSVNGLLQDNFMFLQNNLSNDLLLSNSNTFVFSLPLDDQSNYSISIETQALNPIQPCTIVNGSSTIAGADITDVEVNCEIGDDLIYRDGFEFQQP